MLYNRNKVWPTSQKTPLSYGPWWELQWFPGSCSQTPPLTWHFHTCNSLAKLKKTNKDLLIKNSEKSLYHSFGTMYFKLINFKALFVLIVVSSLPKLIICFTMSVLNPMCADPESFSWWGRGGGGGRRSKAYFYLNLLLLNLMNLKFPNWGGGVWTLPPFLLFCKCK